MMRYARAAYPSWARVLSTSGTKSRCAHK
jgi:hypothetical protein